MEWVLILTLATGAVVLPRGYASELECIGAGESVAPACTITSDVFGRAQEICTPRRFVCVPQPIPRRPLVRQPGVRTIK